MEKPRRGRIPFIPASLEAVIASLLTSEGLLALKERRRWRRLRMAYKDAIRSAPLRACEKKDDEGYEPDGDAA